MTFPVSRHAALTSLALAITTPAAFADSLAQTTLSPVIVTATRMSQPANEVLSDNTLITSEEIARSGTGSLIDLLQKQRGIEVSRYGSAGAASSVFIRGASNDQSIVLIDGVRVGSSAEGNANLSTIPLSAIDHVEIIYGPLSTFYGADAIGGVIQVFTKKGVGAPRVSAFAGVGSDATRTYDASVAGATGGEHSLSYALSAGKERSDGFSASNPGNFSYNPDKDGYNKKSVNGQFALDLAKGHEVGLLFLHSRLDARTDSGDPATYDTHGQQTQENVALFTKNTLLPNWISRVQLTQARSQSESDNGTMPWSKYQTSTTQNSVSWQNDIGLGPDMLQILFDHSKEKMSSSSMPELSHERISNSAAASYSLKRGAHLLSISARDDDSSQYGSHLTGALGYGYRISKQLRVGGSLGTSFRAPSFFDLYYPGYGVPTNRPEKGRNAEVGLHFDDVISQWDAVYYHNRLSDLVVPSNPCPVNPGLYQWGCAANVGKALLEGISLSVRRQLGDINLRGNIDLQNPRDEEQGHLLARRAKRHASFAAEYGTGALQGGVELQLSGKRFDDAANTKTMGGYSLLNVFGTYQVARDWSVLMRWNNVANKQYELAKDFATVGSSVFVGLRYGMK